MLPNKIKSWRTGRLFFSCNKWLQNHYQGSAGKYNWEAAIKTGYSKIPGGLQQKTNGQIDLSVCFGNSQCTKPYSEHIFNINTNQNQYHNRDHGYLEKENIVTDITKSIRCRSFSCQVIQGGLVLQVREGYKINGFGDSDFNKHIFERTACLSEIKMIELSLLPVKKTGIIKSGISSIFIGADSGASDNCNNLIANAGFINAEGMIHFLDGLRNNSGGKPIGIRICITNKKDFYDICYAIRKTHFIPDFMVVEEAPGCKDIVYSGNNFSNRLPLYEALLFVSNTLELYGLSGKIKIIAAGNFSTASNVLKAIGLGANAVYSESAEASSHKYYMNRLFLKHRQNPAEIHTIITAGILKHMKSLGFRKIGDITISNILRAEETNGWYHEPGTQYNPVKENHFSDLSPGHISRIRNKKRLA